MKDRAAILPNRRKITYSDGSVEYVTIEYADQPTEEGTLLNKSSLLGDAVVSELGLTQDDPVPSDALVALKRGAIQYNEMPTPSVDYLGSLIFYTGTTGTYIHGHVYECVSSGGESPSYSWVDLNTVDETTIAIVSGGGGVFAGGAVTAQGTPDQTVAVSAGSIITPEGKRYAFNGVSALAATAADVTNPRIDIVYVASDGVVTYLAGTAAASPSQPATPSNGTLLASIARAANDNTIATGDITKKRAFIVTANDFVDVQDLAESSNTFTADFEFKRVSNFSFSIGNTTAKTIIFSNTPSNDYPCDSVFTIKATATAAVTWTLDGRTLVWPAGAPTLTSGYTYDILFSYSPKLGKWIGRTQLGAAN